MFCDDAAVVSVLSTGSTKDPFLSACARSIWLLKAQHNFNLSLSRISGSTKVDADILSRWPFYKSANNCAAEHLKHCTWLSVDNSELIPDFSI